MKKRYYWQCPKCKKYTKVPTLHIIKDVVVTNLALVGVIFIFCFFYFIFIDPANGAMLSGAFFTTLSSTNFDKSDSMKALTYNITSECLEDDICSAYKIFAYIVTTQTYSTTSTLNSVNFTETYKLSDCKNQALEVGNMLYFKGINYRFVIEPSHMYTKAWLNNTWWRVDTTMLVFAPMQKTTN